jgi:hypothetical protein
MTTKEKGINRVLRERLTESDKRDIRMINHVLKEINVRVSESRLILILKSFL